MRRRIGRDRATVIHASRAGLRGGGATGGRRAGVTMTAPRARRDEPATRATPPPACARTSRGPAPRPRARSSGVVSGITASSIASEPYHSAGSASIAHDRHRPALVARRAPDDQQHADRRPDDERDRDRGPRAALALVGDRAASTHARHCPGRTSETARSRPSHPARSRATATRAGARTTAAPTPGVILVSSTNAQVHGHRNPATIATASSSEMLPPAISIAPTTSPSRNRSGPVSQKTAPIRIAVQAATNTGHGSRLSGQTGWANAGEYG